VGADPSQKRGRPKCQVEAIDQAWWPTGIMGAACVQGGVRNTGGLGGRGGDRTRRKGVARTGVRGAHSTCEAGNDRGGKGPWFRVLFEEWTSGRLA
jgi:hypothetical protein